MTVRPSSSLVVCKQVAARRRCLGQQSSRVEQLRRVARTCTRDSAGRVTKVEKASGRTSELSYDAAGRITEVVHSDGTFERYRYRGDGVMIEASNDAAEVHFERDPMGRVLRERTRLPDGNETWVKSGYGPDGHRVRVESSDGHLHHIERNLAGDVLRVDLENGRWHADFERDRLLRRQNERAQEDPFRDSVPPAFLICALSSTCAAAVADVIAAEASGVSQDT
jgi:YD repeat-containing protein